MWVLGRSASPVLSQELDILILPSEYWIVWGWMYSRISDWCRIVSVEGVTEMVRWAPSDRDLWGERRKWFISKRICQSLLIARTGQAMDRMWTFALSSSSESFAFSDAATTVNAWKRPVKVRGMVLVVREHNDNTERRQITALSRVKIFPSSQMKQIVLKAVPPKTTAVMPNTIEYTLKDLLITVFSWQFPEWLERQKNCCSGKMVVYRKLHKMSS